MDSVGQLSVLLIAMATLVLQLLRWIVDNRLPKNKTVDQSTDSLSQCEDELIELKTKLRRLSYRYHLLQEYRLDELFRLLDNNKNTPS